VWSYEKMRFWQTNKPMSGTALLVITLVWLVTVLVSSRMGFGFFIRGNGNVAKAAMQILLYLIFLLTSGWLMPLGVGIYRLIKKRKNSN
jgi:hypothetical protein